MTGDNNTTSTVPKVTRLSRDEIRAKLFSSKNKIRASEKLIFFGTEIELRQPSVGDIQKMGENTEELNKIPFTRMLVDYAYVPDSDEKIFEDGDIESLNQLPFGPDIQKITAAIERFTDLSIKDAVKN